MQYNKLIRDKIPQNLDNKNVKYKIHIADEKEYEEKLREKLGEEVQEFLKSSNVEELADILEVVYALCDFYKIDKENLEKIRKDKFEKKGGLKNKIILEES
ncbi:MAG: nucleoside triphosphate pyrophosphohydrolase [Patescibacteria group bacterium]|nr:nucleoside triphosphate pyrophosphohydrolase [Patescibacteria group bacterium]